MLIRNSSHSVFSACAKALSNKNVNQLCYTKKWAKSCQSFSTNISFHSTQRLSQQKSLTRDNKFIISFFIKFSSSITNVICGNLCRISAKICAELENFREVLAAMRMDGVGMFFSAFSLIWLCRKL